MYLDFLIRSSKLESTTSCLVQVGNGIELEAVGLQFEPYRWRPCGVTWDSSRTVVVIKLRRTSALTTARSNRQERNRPFQSPDSDSHSAVPRAPESPTGTSETQRSRQRQCPGAGRPRPAGGPQRPQWPRADSRLGPRRNSLSNSPSPLGRARGRGLI